MSFALDEANGMFLMINFFFILPISIILFRHSVLLLHLEFSRSQEECFFRICERGLRFSNLQ